MPKQTHNIVNDQKGSALMMTVLVMLALTAIGITAMRTSTMDVTSSTNFKFDKMVTYATDGATQMAAELLEQNIEERGFDNPTMRESVQVDNPDFYFNEEDTVTPSMNCPSDTNRDIAAPNLGMGSVNIKVYGDTRLSTGNALQIAAGDKGRGKGLAGGGAWIVYEIRSRGRGPNQSSASVNIRWIHVI